MATTTKPAPVELTGDERERLIDWLQVARSEYEMCAYEADLRVWASRKISQIDADIEWLESNLTVAVTMARRARRELGDIPYMRLGSGNDPDREADFFAIYDRLGFLDRLARAKAVAS